MNYCSDSALLLSFNIYIYFFFTNAKTLTEIYKYLYEMPEVLINIMPCFTEIVAGETTQEHDFPSFLGALERISSRRLGEAAVRHFWCLLALSAVCSPHTPRCS